MSERCRAEPVDVVLFDLGGVLVELGGATEYAASRGLDLAAFWERWLACPCVRRYETGGCDTATFARDLVASWPGLAPADEFLEHFARWPRHLYPGVRDALGRLRGRVRTAVLSNTNPLHWEREQRTWDLEALVDEHFLSFRMGLVKPDAAAYEHVLERLGVRPGAVLFLDDNRANVQGARTLGIQAEHVLGFDAARHVLERRGLL